MKPQKSSHWSFNQIKDWKNINIQQQRDLRIQHRNIDRLVHSRGILKVSRANLSKSPELTTSPDHVNKKMNDSQERALNPLGLNPLYSSRDSNNPLSGEPTIDQGQQSRGNSGLGDLYSKTKDTYPFIPSARELPGVSEAVQVESSQKEAINQNSFSNNTSIHLLQGNKTVYEDKGDDPYESKVPPNQGINVNINGVLTHNAEKNKQAGVTTYARTSSVHSRKQSQMSQPKGHYRDPKEYEFEKSNCSPIEAGSAVVTNEPQVFSRNNHEMEPQSSFRNLLKQEVKEVSSDQEKSFPYQHSMFSSQRQKLADMKNIEASGQSKSIASLHKVSLSKSQEHDQNLLAQPQNPVQNARLSISSSKKPELQMNGGVVTMGALTNGSQNPDQPEERIETGGHIKSADVREQSGMDDVSSKQQKQALLDMYLGIDQLRIFENVDDSPDLVSQHFLINQRKVIDLEKMALKKYGTNIHPSGFSGAYTGYPVDEQKSFEVNGRKIGIPKASFSHSQSRQQPFPRASPPPIILREKVGGVSPPPPPFKVTGRRVSERKMIQSFDNLKQRSPAARVDTTLRHSKNSAWKPAENSIDIEISVLGDSPNKSFDETDFPVLKPMGERIQQTIHEMDLSKSGTISSTTKKRNLKIQEIDRSKLKEGRIPRSQIATYLKNKHIFKLRQVSTTNQGSQVTPPHSSWVGNSFRMAPEQVQVEARQPIQQEILQEIKVLEQTDRSSLNLAGGDNTRDLAQDLLLIQRQIAGHPSNRRNRESERNSTSFEMESFAHEKHGIQGGGAKIAKDTSRDDFQRSHSNIVNLSEVHKQASTQMQMDSNETMLMADPQRTLHSKREGDLAYVFNVEHRFISKKEECRPVNHLEQIRRLQSVQSAMQSMAAQQSQPSQPSVRPLGEAKSGGIALYQREQKLDVGKASNKGSRIRREKKASLIEGIVANFKNQSRQLLKPKHAKAHATFIEVARAMGVKVAEERFRILSQPQKKEEGLNLDDNVTAQFPTESQMQPHATESDKMGSDLVFLDEKYPQELSQTTMLANRDSKYFEARSTHPRVSKLHINIQDKLEESTCDDPEKEATTQNCPNTSSGDRYLAPVTQPLVTETTAPVRVTPTRLTTNTSATGMQGTTTGKTSIQLTKVPRLPLKQESIRKEPERSLTAMDQRPPTSHCPLIDIRKDFRGGILRTHNNSIMMNEYPYKLLKHHRSHVARQRRSQGGSIGYSSSVVKNFKDSKIQENLRFCTQKRNPFLHDDMINKLLGPISNVTRNDTDVQASKAEVIYLQKRSSAMSQKSGSRVSRDSVRRKYQRLFEQRKEPGSAATTQEEVEAYVHHKDESGRIINIQYSTSSGFNRGPAIEPVEVERPETQQATGILKAPSRPTPAENVYQSTAQNEPRPIQKYIADKASKLANLNSKKPHIQVGIPVYRLQPLALGPQQSEKLGSTLGQPSKQEQSTNRNPREETSKYLNRLKELESSSRQFSGRFDLTEVSK